MNRGKYNPLVLAIIALAGLAVAYGSRCVRFEHRWNTLGPGTTVKTVLALVGKPDDDRMRADILGARKTKIVWEYARGLYVYEAYFEPNQHDEPTILHSLERRTREGWEWISLRARRG